MKKYVVYENGKAIGRVDAKNIKEAFEVWHSYAGPGNFHIERLAE